MIREINPKHISCTYRSKFNPGSKIKCTSYWIYKTAHKPAPSSIRSTCHTMISTINCASRMVSTRPSHEKTGHSSPEAFHLVAFYSDICLDSYSHHCPSCSSHSTLLSLADMVVQSACYTSMSHPGMSYHAHHLEHPRRRQRWKGEPVYR